MDSVVLNIAQRHNVSIGNGYWLRRSLKKINQKEGNSVNVLKKDPVVCFFLNIDPYKSVSVCFRKHLMKVNFLQYILHWLWSKIHIITKCRTLSTSFRATVMQPVMYNSNISWAIVDFNVESLSGQLSSHKPPRRRLRASPHTCTVLYRRTP